MSAGRISVYTRFLYRLSKTYRCGRDCKNLWGVNMNTKRSVHLCPGCYPKGRYIPPRKWSRLSTKFPLLTTVLHASIFLLRVLLPPFVKWRFQFGGFKTNALCEVGGGRALRERPNSNHNAQGETSQNDERGSTVAGRRGAWFHALKRRIAPQHVTASRLKQEGLARGAWLAMSHGRRAVLHFMSYSS